MTQLADYEKLRSAFKKIGIHKATKITDTLQGSIWRTLVQLHGSSTLENLVTKVTSNEQHKNAICVIDNKAYHCKEDILLEQRILKYLSKCADFPPSIVKFRRFYKSSTHYYLLMEDGGVSLFDFVKNAHNIINIDQLSISEWTKVVKVIFRQMIECIAFIHSHNVTHNDISLENFLINDIDVEVTYANGKMTSDGIEFVTEDIQIKLCDFGLAEAYEDAACKSDKQCGKTLYKSPEIAHNAQCYYAKKNDIWGVGVCLFMMMFGCPPWNEASVREDRFVWIMNGYLCKLLRAWDIYHYADAALIDLLQRIFQYEEHRIDIEGIKRHPWFGLHK